MLDEVNIIILILLASGIIILLFSIAGKKASKHRNKLQNKKIQEIFESSPYRRPIHIQKPNNDFLSRDKKSEALKLEEKAEAIENGVTQYNPHNLSQEPEQTLEQTKIVGIVETQGFWSKFIIGQKLGYIMARVSAQQSDKGFWANLIKAQSMSQGKDQGRRR